MKRSITISVKLYSWLLKLYPEAFRAQYGDEILLLFRDCCRDIGDSHAALFDLWLHSLGDLIVNVCAERLKQILTREWLGETVVSVSGLAMMLFSGVAMGWIVLGITIGLLVPWDLGTPPAGTFAEAVNNFFERGFVVLPAGLVLLLDVVAFFRTALSGWHKTSTLYWRYAAFHMMVILIGIAMTAAAMAINRSLFPNTDSWAGDQSYGVSLIYWGLLIVGGILAFFVYQVRAAPNILWFNSKRKRKAKVSPN